mmetsp:Transcript_4901/g.8885  ORF Transcript_4901/g.8885 Transcript_4901/m.8885 type:complete len:239 (-) Transcript_4901:103-819(-)
MRGAQLDHNVRVHLLRHEILRQLREDRLKLEKLEDLLLVLVLQIPHALQHLVNRGTRVPQVLPHLLNVLDGNGAVDVVVALRHERVPQQPELPEVGQLRERLVQLHLRHLHPLPLLSRKRFLPLLRFPEFVDDKVSQKFERVERLIATRKVAVFIPHRARRQVHPVAVDGVHQLLQSLRQYRIDLRLLQIAPRLLRVHVPLLHRLVHHHILPHRQHKLVVRHLVGQAAESDFELLPVH